MSESIFEISDTYQVVEVDFTSVVEANDNENFQFRIRFDGVDMEVNNGDRVTFNNFAIHGYANPSLSTNEVESKDSVVVFPNPFSNSINLKGNQDFKDFEIYGLQGNLIKKGQLVNNRITTEELYQGIYILILRSKNLISHHKIVKK